MATGRGISRGIGTGLAQIIEQTPSDFNYERVQEQKEPTLRERLGDVGEAVGIPEDIYTYQQLRKGYRDGLAKYDMMQDKSTPEAEQLALELTQQKNNLNEFAEISEVQQKQYDQFVKDFYNNEKYDKEDVERILMDYQSATPFERLEMRRGGLPIPKMVAPEKEPWHPNFIKEVDASIKRISDEQGYETISQVYGDEGKTKEIVKSWVQQNATFPNRGGGVIERYNIPVDESGIVQWNTPEGEQAVEELTKELINRAGSTYQRSEDEGGKGLNLNFGGGSYKDEDVTITYSKEDVPTSMTYEEYIENVAGGESIPREHYEEYLQAMGDLSESEESIFIGKSNGKEQKQSFVTGESTEEGEKEVVQAVPIGIKKKSDGTKVIVAVEQVTSTIEGKPPKYIQRELPYTAENKSKIASAYQYTDPKTNKKKAFDYEEVIKQFKGDEEEFSEEDVENIKSQYGISY